MSSTSILLGAYFEEFIQNQISSGRYKDESEVLRAALRLLEDEEDRVNALRNAIQKGLDSPIVEDFDFDNHLEYLKSDSPKIMTTVVGIEIKRNEKGQNTSIQIDLEKYGKQLEPFLQEIGMIEDDFETEWENSLTIDEAKEQSLDKIRKWWNK